MTDRGKLVTFEGGEGAGKGTQLERIKTKLDVLGADYITVREPGGTEIGEKIRALLLDVASKNMAPEAELLLYGAARAQIIYEVVEGALRRGKIVVCDRFYDSTTAYQGFGRGLNRGFIAAMNRFVTGGLVPDLTVYLDIDPVVGLARATGQGADRLEQEDISFHQAVREGFLWIATQEPERFKVINAHRTVEEVADDVSELVLPVLLERK